jgi:CheY-like chemotaxis protein
MSPEEKENQQETPQSTADDDEQGSPPAEQTSEDSVSEQPYALIVEDTLSNFLFVGQILTRMGFHCEWNSTGRYVTELAEGYPRIDLIVLDIRLPHEDGFSILENLRSSDKVKDVPVLAITAFASERQLEEAKKAGFNGYLAKPLDDERFEDQVNAVLSGDSVWET